MRAMKSILNIAGYLKLENPELEENWLLINAMRDANEAKFTEDDLSLFKAIVTDLFPNVAISTDN